MNSRNHLTLLIAAPQAIESATPPGVREQAAMTARDQFVLRRGGKSNATRRPILTHYLDHILLILEMSCRLANRAYLQYNCKYARRIDHD